MILAGGAESVKEKTVSVGMPPIPAVSVSEEAGNQILYLSKIVNREKVLLACDVFGSMYANYNTTYLMCIFFAASTH